MSRFDHITPRRRNVPEDYTLGRKRPIYDAAPVYEPDPGEPVWGQPVYQPYKPEVVAPDPKEPTPSPPMLEPEPEATECDYEPMTDALFRALMRAAPGEGSALEVASMRSRIELAP